MRKVILNLKEQQKYEVIKKLVDTDGNIQRASLKLNCSTRTIYRLIKVYKEKGKLGFIHGNRDKEPANKISDELKRQIQDIYCLHLTDANYRHATELLSHHFHINISETTLRKILNENFILSPKAHRITRRTIKRKLKELKKHSHKKSDIIALDRKIDTLERYDAHPRRPRCAYFGELVQMDASSYKWFGEEVYHLHLAIDDATGKILGGYFDEQETLNGYYQVLYQILTKHGIPAKFLTDARTVFEYKKKNASSDEEDTFTQFSYACHQLGIELDVTSVPEAKGRVERLNGTVQSRIPVEFKLKGITTVDQANHELMHFIEAYNEKFGLHIHDSKTVFEKQPNEEKINVTLAILANRVIDSGHCIKFQNKYYVPITETGLEQYYPHKTKALIIQSFDGGLYASINDEIFGLKEIPRRHEKSKEFDFVPEKAPRKINIPSMHHPWRIGSFAAHLHKQKHRNSGAHV